MRDDILEQTIEDTLLTKLYNYFLWVLSFFCLFLAATYWARLIGVLPGELWRFDLMPDRWKLLTVFMSIVYPLAACGLWMRSQWGIVLWLLAGTIESLAMTVYAHDYVWFPQIAILHATFLITFLLLRLLLFFQKRRQSQVRTRS